MDELEVSSSDIALSVLRFKEDWEWVALALGTDLIGYGATFEEAVEDDLREVVLLRIAFVQHMSQPAIIWRAPTRSGFSSLPRRRVPQPWASRPPGDCLLRA